MGYAPMKSSKFIKITPASLGLLQQCFPVFLLFIFLVPFFYLTTRLAAEKEYKAKEGMRMMGLKDRAYYLSWVIHYAIISAVISCIITIMATCWLFHNINAFLFLCFSFFFSLTLCGQAFCIVAFLQTPRNSGVAAVLWVIMTYYISFALQDPSASSFS